MVSAHQAVVVKETQTPTLSPEMEKLFDRLAKAPPLTGFNALEMIQRHGEYEHSRFPSKHHLLFELGEGLGVNGYSDTWVNPPNMYLQLVQDRGSRLTIPELEIAFKQRTGQDLFNCAIREAHHLLSTGNFNKTLRQELDEAIKKDVTTPPGIATAMEIINRAVDKADASAWKGSEPNYNALSGRGYLLDLRDSDNPPDSSNIHPHVRLVIGVSTTGAGPLIELGHRNAYSGAFQKIATIEGEPAKELFSKVNERIQNLQARLDAEKQLIQTSLVDVIEHSPLQDWKFSTSGDTKEVRGKISSFNVTFSATQLAHFEGISALVNPKLIAATQDGPYLMDAKPSPAQVSDALHKIMSGRADSGGVLLDRFDESGPVGQHLLRTVSERLAHMTPEAVSKYSKDWHANHATINNPTWKVVTNNPESQYGRQFAVLSTEGISVGCWRGGQSGGYQEAFKLTSPKAIAIANAALQRIEEMKSATV